MRQLTGFARVPLEPGASGRRAVPRARRPDRVHRPRPATGSSSPGTSRCCVGTSAADLPCRGTVRLTGAAARGRPRPAAGHAGASSAPAGRGRQEDQIVGAQGPAYDAGHRRRLGRRVGRDGLQGGQRPQPTSRRRPARGCRDRCCSSTTTSAGDRRRPAAPRTATVELTFARRPQRATPSRSIQGVAGRRRRRSASPSPSACDRRSRGGPTAGAAARGPATWSPPGAGPSSPSPAT